MCGAATIAPAPVSRERRVKVEEEEVTRAI
jgi:hypothetical protein